MSFFRLFFPLLAIFAVFLHLFLLNPGDAELVWASGRTARLPLILLLMAAFFLGAAALAAVNLFKEAGDAFDAMEERMRRWKVGRIESRLADARLKAEQGFADRALGTLQNLLDRQPRHYEALLLKGDLLRRLGRHAEALGAHSLALSLRPAARKAALRIKDDYKAAGNWDAAHGLLERMREHWPDDLEILADMRTVNLARGDFRRALLAQREVLARTGEKTRPAEQAALAETALLYGEQLMAEGKPDEAADQFSAAVRLEPGFLAARMLLAESLNALGRRGEAETVLLKEYRVTRNIIPLLRLAAIARAEGGAAGELETITAAMAAAPDEKLPPLLAAALEIELGLLDAARARIASLNAAAAATPLADAARSLLELRAAPAPDASSIAALEQELNSRRAGLVQYLCQACGAAEADYFPQCPSCGAWNAAAPRIEGFPAS